jgi:plastocyanin
VRVLYTSKSRSFAVTAVAVALVLVAACAGLLAGIAARTVTASAALSTDATGADPIMITVGPAIGYSVTKISVTAGQAVSIELVQTDSTFHTFTLSPVKNFQLPLTDTPVDVYAFFNHNPPLANISVPAVAGSSAWANFTAPNATGAYEYLCENPGHFQAGMHGNLTVASASSNSGLQGALAGLIAVLIVVIIVLIVIAVVAVVLMRRRRRRMTPPPTSGPAASEPPGAGP